jgi:IS30 family transposase
MAATHSHLSLSDRIYIEQALERRMNFKDIAVFIEKDPTTVSKEIRRHRTAKESGKKTAICENRSTCTRKNMCHHGYCNKLCGKCTLHYCHYNCEDYQAPVCRRLTSPPYVCNGCGLRNCRQDVKYYYRAQVAEQEYRAVLSDTRKGINKTALELDDLDRLISPLLKQGQPLSHIFATHEAEIGCSRRSVYHYLEQGAFSAGPLDLPRKVRYKPRKKRKSTTESSIPNYRIGRTYKDFERYMETNPEANVVEMDTVEGSRSGPVLLTMLFRSCGFMLIFLLTRNTQADVCEVFEAIEQALGTQTMQELFEAILTDNGPEFKNPTILEQNLSGKRRTRVFYCDPMSSWQKGRLEKNHEFIRYILPKGRPFDSLTKGQVTKIMNHINSTARASLNDRTPFELASLLLPAPLLAWSGATAVPHDEVLLKPRLLKAVKP